MLATPASPETSTRRNPPGAVRSAAAVFGGTAVLGMYAGVFDLDVGVAGLYITAGVRF